MTRIMGIDYGTKRVGIAVTDPLQIIASSLDTVPTDRIFDYLQDYLSREPVSVIAVGEPLELDGRPAQIHHLVMGFIRRLRELFPEVEVVLQDERFTSSEAKKTILQSGAKKKKRRDKSLVDKVSAAIILQDYLESVKR